MCTENGFQVAEHQQQDSDVDPTQLENTAPPSIPALCRHDQSCNRCWVGYPQSRFPNWARRQVVKSKIHRAIYEYDRSTPCVLHRVDVDSEGIFKNAGTIKATDGLDDEVWKTLIADHVCGEFSLPFGKCESDDLLAAT